MSIKTLNGADALALNRLNSPNTESIRMSKDQLEAASAFESYMIEMMVKEMRKTIPEGMFSGGQSEVFSGMFDQEISKRMSEVGGFGFRDLMGDAMGVGRATPTPASFLPISGGKLPSPRGHGHVHAHDHHQRSGDHRGRHRA